MHPFPEGTRVETNDEYFKQFGRKVIGTSVDFNPLPPNEITVVRWESQYGNKIPKHQGNKVIMMSNDLQIHIPN